MSITKTKVKKDGLQQYRVRVRYTDVTGNVKQVERTVYGYAEAQEKERELLRLGVHGERTLTVSELCQEYLTAKSVDIREATLDKVRRVIRSSIEPYLYTYRVDKLTPAILQGWKKALAERDLSFDTRKKYYSTLNSILRFAVKQDYIKENPLDRVGGFRNAYPEDPQEKLHYYTKEQFAQYISRAKIKAQNENNILWWGVYTFFCLAFFTGARKGEINALRWSDIDGGTMRIRRSVSQKIKGGDRFTPPKNKSSFRDVKLPDRLLEILAEQKERQASRRGFSENDLVCGGKACLRDSSIERANTLFAQEAGLPHIRIHDFRHTHATLLINEGINVQEIARRLGHSDIKMTWNTYSHLYPVEEERALKIREKIEL